MHDPYELLGLHPGVGAAEIKRAFRQLAMRWHPDRNADPGAAERFNSLRGAYETLLAGLAPSPPLADEAAPADEPAHGADRWMDLELSIDEAFHGSVRILAVHDEIDCAQCAGRGIETLTLSRLCAPCRGSGRLRVDGESLHCPDCKGRGYRTTAECSACNGSGRQMGERHLEVRVPPGLIDDDVLRLNGEGEAHPQNEGRRGALNLRIRLASHPLYSRKGRDLVLQRPVSALRMMIGGEVRVPHPAGKHRLRIEAGEALARSVRVSGAGIPARQNKPAGDFIVDLRPELPRAADARMHQLIAQLEEACALDPELHLPELAQWEAQWLD